MNNTCQQNIPGYNSLKNQLLKIRNNKTLSGISKLRKIANLASSDRYKNFQSAYKTKCPAQYKKSQMMLSKFKKVFKKIDLKKKETLTKVFKKLKK